MKLDKIECVERSVMELVLCALTDYYHQAVRIFMEEADTPKDIAEDVLREAVETMGVSRIHERLYGRVDLKRALYAFVPEPQPVALMLDAKSEIERENTGDQESVTTQLSQTSMKVMMRKRTGSELEYHGKLGSFINRGKLNLLVVTIIAKYVHAMVGDTRALLCIKVACIPNGILQNRYNPTSCDTIWLAGKSSSSIRLSYGRLRAKAPWRVRTIAPSREKSH